MCYEKRHQYLWPVSLVVHLLMLGQSKIANFAHFDYLVDIYNEKLTHWLPVYCSYLFSRSSTP